MLTAREKKRLPRNLCTCVTREACAGSFIWTALWTQGRASVCDSHCHGYLVGCYSLEAKVEPGGWCPLAGDNPESSAPRGACRQEGVSLHRERGGNKEQWSEPLSRRRGKGQKAGDEFTVGNLTWHLKRAAGVRAGWRLREGGAAAATSRRVWVTVDRWAGEGGGHWVGLSKGLREGGILWHVRLVLLQGVAEARQHRVLGVELAVPRYQHRGQHWGGRETWKWLKQEMLAMHRKSLTYVHRNDTLQTSQTRNRMKLFLRVDFFLSFLIMVLWFIWLFWLLR